MRLSSGFRTLVICPGGLVFLPCFCGSILYHINTKARRPGNMFFRVVAHVAAGFGGWESSSFAADLCRDWR